MFTATKVQAATYLLGVCLFSIAFLVFLNSSLSFVITDIIRRKDGIGDAVGSLGFADELVALVACPAWGILSDRIGVRLVASLGYTIVGVALIVFVQAQHVYPDLLLARMFFSIGGAATVTMVTAILPAMTQPRSAFQPPTMPAHRPTSSTSSELTITPERLGTAPSKAESPSRLAGFVGMFTGCGALVALGFFLPLPTWFKQQDVSDAQALRNTFYVVGTVSLVVAVGCFLGLRNLHGEGHKTWRNLWLPAVRQHDHRLSYRRLVVGSLRAARDDPRIALGYLGGFVARASSVGISLFIPLFINAYYVDQGLCDTPSGDPSAVKEQCRAAYLLAAQLTGISQLCALLAAPIFGFVADRSPRYQVPLLLGALCGVLGYSGFAALHNPLITGDDGSRAVIAIVCLLGISQISAIVCSLGLLSRAVDGLEDAFLVPSLDDEDEPEADSASVAYEVMAHTPTTEASRLLGGAAEDGSRKTPLRALQGTIAGTYSLFGGAGIMLLTKAGGVLFDDTARAAPFIMLAGFNLLLFAGGLVFALLPMVKKRS